MRSDRYENFEQKTEDWLSAADLKKSGRIVATVDEIRSALYRHQKDMPEYIKIKGRKTRTVICLFNDGQIIDQFRKLAGFSTPEEKHVSEWLSAQELENTHICASADVIKNLLYQFRPEMPKYIQVKVKRVDDHDRRVLCLFGNPLVIRSFCIMAKLQQPTDLKPRENEWLTVGELCKKFNCSPVNLLSVVQNILSNMLEEINPQMIFAIRNDDTVIDAFREKIDLMSAQTTIPIAPVPVTTSTVSAANEKVFNAKDWISVSGLIKNKLAHGTAAKISSTLKEWQETNPDDVLQKIFRGSEILYLRNDPSVIEHFNKKLNTKERKRRTKPILEDGWLSIAVLFKKKMVVGTYKKVENALKNWRKNNPDEVMEKTRGDGFSYYLRNDSDVIKRFSEALKTKKVKPAEKKPTEILPQQWLSANGLEYEYIDAGYTAISEKLLVLQYKMPDSIKHQETSRGRRLCLKRTAIESFCRLARLQAITTKTESWLSITELQDKKYSSDTHEKIRGILNLNKNYKPEYVQMKRQSGGKKELCLLNDPDAIAWFRRKSGLAPINKTVWINVQDLAGNYIMSDTETIVERIKEIECDMPKDVWIVDNGDHCEIYLHRDAIPTFCKYARLKSKDDMATAINTAISAVKGATAKSNQSQKS